MYIYPICLVHYKGSSNNESSALDHHGRASSTDPSAAFKPQPSPRIVRSSLGNWRSPPASSTTTSTSSGPHNGIMSGTSGTPSSYFSLRTDRNPSQFSPQPQKVFLNIIFLTFHNISQLIHFC